MKLNRRDFLKISGIIIGGFPLRTKLDKLAGFGINFEDVQVLEQEEWGIATSISMPVIRIPLLDDGFWDESKPVKLFNIKEGVELGYSKRRELRIDDSIIHSVLIPSSIGGNYIHVGIISVEIHGHKNKFAEIETGVDGRNIFSIIGDYYPNKIFNILEGATRVLKTQREIGYLSGGEEYSLLELMNVRDGDDGFIKGYTTFHVEVNAGGICGFSTTFSNSVAKNSEIIKLWEHPAKYKYFVPPADPERSESTTDSSLSWFDDGGFDLNFVPDNDMKLKITCDLVRTGETEIDDLGPGADMLMVFSLKWMSEFEDADDGLEELELVRVNYSKYRDDEESGNFPNEIEIINWDSERDEIQLIKNIYPEEVVDHFIPELHNDKWIMLVANLVREINVYADLYKDYDRDDVLYDRIPGLGDHLYEKAFSVPHFHNEDGSVLHLLRDALWHLNYVTFIDGKATWSVGFSGLLGSLYSIFGNVVPRRLLGYNFNYAADIVPDEYRDFEIQYRYKTESGYILSSPANEHEVNVGDVLVRYETIFGHSAVVIGKKSVGDKTILLLADANRKGRGIARLYQVDEVNFKHVFGQFPVKPVVVN